MSNVLGTYSFVISIWKLHYSTLQSTLCFRDLASVEVKVEFSAYCKQEVNNNRTIESSQAQFN